MLRFLYSVEYCKTNLPLNINLLNNCAHLLHYTLFIPPSIMLYLPAHGSLDPLVPCVEHRSLPATHGESYVKLAFRRK